MLDGYKIGIASVASTRDDHGLDPVPQGQRAAVILWTDDTAAAYAALTASGAPALAAPHRWLDRLLIAWTADPDGNPIQIVQTALSWAAPNRDPSADDKRSLRWREGPCGVGVTCAGARGEGRVQSCW